MSEYVTCSFCKNSFPSSVIKTKAIINVFGKVEVHRVCPICWSFQYYLQLGNDKAKASNNK